MGFLKKFDFHCHSSYSDGESSIYQIEEFCLKSNIGISLTDHNEIRGSIKLFERNKISLILGMEIGTAEGIEVLIYFNKVHEMEFFYKSQIEPYRKKCIITHLRNRLENILEAIGEIDAFVSLAHPSSILQQRALNKIEYRDPYLFNLLFRKIHAIEIFNGNLTYRQNQLSAELMEKYKKKFTVGSDAHQLKFFGYTNACVETEDQQKENFFLKLQSNDFSEVFFIENKKRFIPILKSAQTNALHYVKCKIYNLLGRENNIHIES